MFLYNKRKRDESDELAGETWDVVSALAFYSTLMPAEVRSCLCNDKMTPILKMALVSTRSRSVCSHDLWPLRGFGGERARKE